MIEVKVTSKHRDYTMENVFSVADGQMTLRQLYESNDGSGESEVVFTRAEVSALCGFLGRDDVSSWLANSK